MEGRKWEDLNTDCLANIFGRLDMASKLLYIQLVCKQWHRAVLNSLCWQKLDFPVNYVVPLGKILYNQQNPTELITYVVNLSQRRATSLVIPYDSSTDELLFFSDECPDLKMVWLQSDILLDDNEPATILGILPKWKKLEFLSYNSSYRIIDMIVIIRNHLPNFISLHIPNIRIETKVALAIVSLHQRLRYLTMHHCKVQKEDLLLIMRSCKELEFLDAQKCIGFDEDDEEIWSQSVTMKKFLCDGSTSYDKGNCYVDMYDGDDFGSDN